MFSVRAAAPLAAMVASVGFLPALATSGGLNAEGCHNDRKGGTGYHCHRGSSSANGASTEATVPRLSLAAGHSRTFPNCASARAAGAAPIRRGDAGYGAHLDRDDDGVACE